VTPTNISVRREKDSLPEGSASRTGAAEAARTQGFK